MQNIQDKRTGIVPGQIIALKDTNNGLHVDFIIEKEIGRGGSCIVYSATYKQNDITRHCRLKEFYPADNSNYYYDISRNGTELKIADAAQEQFESRKERFLEGVKKQILFYESIAKTRNQTTYVGGIYEGGNTLFYTMLCDQGVSYDCVEDKSLIDILKTGKAISQAVQSYHNYEVSGEKNPILHLDIKPQNIFVLQESREVIKLFDFDSVVNKNELDGSNVMISGSEGYMPYEVRDASKHYLISEKSDIYSIGAIVFERIVGRRLTMQDEDNGYVDIEQNNPLFANISVAIFKKLDKFFEKTCLGRMKQRYSNVEELIDAFDELMEYAKPIEYSLKKFLPSVTSSFLGRENELNDIDQELENSNYVILSGMGGIGKTELAITYANIAEQNKKYNCFFINYQENLHSTIINMEFENIEQYYIKNNIDANNKENVFDAKIDLLSKLGNTTLLVIDNMDMNSENVSAAVNEPAFIKLVSCGIKIIFTSRNKFEEHCLSVGTLREDELLKMIDHDETNIEIVKELIKTVEYHTLTVDLIGKTIRESWGEITPKIMLELLRNNEIENDSFDDVMSSKDRASGLGNEFNAKLYEHIKKLFSLAKLSGDEIECLQNTVLFGNKGIDARKFISLGGTNSKKTIKTLVRKGWLILDDETYKLKAHPIIQMLVSNEKLDLSNNQFYNDICRRIIAEYNGDLTNIKEVLSIVQIWVHNPIIQKSIAAFLVFAYFRMLNINKRVQFSSCTEYLYIVECARMMLGDQPLFEKYVELIDNQINKDNVNNFDDTVAEELVKDIEQIFDCSTQINKLCKIHLLRMISFKLLSVVTQKMKCFNTDTKTEKTKQILNCIEKIAQYHQLALETIPVNYMANIELVKKTFFTPHNNSKTLYIANEEVWRKCYTFEDAWLYVELGDILIELENKYIVFKESACNTFINHTRQKYETALGYYLIAEKLFTQIMPPIHIRKQMIHLRIAKVYDSLSCNDKAKLYLDTSIKMFDELNGGLFKDGYIFSFDNVNYLKDFYQFRYDFAIKNSDFLSAISSKKELMELENKENDVDSLMKIAELSERVEDWRAAAEYYKASVNEIEISRHILEKSDVVSLMSSSAVCSVNYVIGEMSRLVSIYNKIGDLLIRVKDADEAEVYYSKAADLLQCKNDMVKESIFKDLLLYSPTSGKPIDMIDYHRNRGNTYEQILEHEKAVDNYVALLNYLCRLYMESMILHTYCVEQELYNCKAAKELVDDWKSKHTSNENDDRNFLEFAQKWKDEIIQTYEHIEKLASIHTGILTKDDLDALLMEIKTVFADCEKV